MCIRDRYSSSYSKAILPMKSIDAFFDHNEPFMNVVMQAWNNKTVKREQPYWALMRLIAAVDASAVTQKRPMMVTSKPANRK